MHCPKCGHKARKNGLRPVRRKGVSAKRQSYLCTNPICYYQWEQR